MKRLLLLLCLVLPVGAQEPLIVMPAVIRDSGVFVTARIGDRPVFLVVDTGAAYTHLDSRFLNLPRSKRTLATLTGDGAANLQVLEPVKLTVADKVFDIETLDLNLLQHRNQCACDVAGVLGLDILRRFDSFSVDFESRTVSLRRKKL